MPTPPANAVHFFCASCGGYLFFAEQEDAKALMDRPQRCRRDRITCPARGPIEAWRADGRNAYLGTCKERS